MTSATALLRRAGNQTWALFSSQGRWPRPSSFSYAPRRSFEQWCAASRTLSALMTPVLVRPGYPSLPSRDASKYAPPTSGFTRPLRSEDWRARVEGPSEGRVPIRMQRCPVPASGAYALNCVSRRRSPPRRPSDIRCHRRVRLPRRKPRQPKTSRPRPSFRQRPAKSAAFQKTGMPSSVTTREGNERGRFNPSGLRAGSLAHAAHTFSPSWGECFVGHCKCHGAVTRDPWRFHPQMVREYSRLCYSPKTRLGLTTQARRWAHPTRPSTEADCPARTDAGRSA